MEHKAFEKIIGYENVKQELYRILDRLCSPEKYAALGVTPSHGLLLHGAPGVGKSTLAQCFVEASGQKVIVCRKDKSNGGFVDRITQIFEEAAQAAPCVVLLEDMDKFSNEDDSHRDAEEYVAVQAGIDAVHDKPVFVVATVNNLHKLPASLVRAGRFDHVLQINPPSRKDAQAIISHYLRRKSYVADLDMVLITRLLDGHSCAELETIINEAGVHAGFAGRSQIAMEDMLKAYLRVAYEAPYDCEEDERSLLPIACHEAGHAVVSELLEPGSVNLISVSGCHNADGITSLHRPSNYFRSLKYMENRVMVLLAGKAATELFMGEVDTGSGDDVDRAYRIVSRFCDEYSAYGFDYVSSPDHDSEALRSRRESRISADLAKYYNQAKQLLARNRKFLDVLIERLLADKLVLADQVQAIRQETAA